MVTIDRIELPVVRGSRVSVQWHVTPEDFDHLVDALDIPTGGVKPFYDEAHERLQFRSCKTKYDGVDVTIFGADRPDGASEHTTVTEEAR